MLSRDSDLGFSNHYPLGSTALKPQPGGPGQGLFFVWSLNSWSIHCSPVTPHMKRCQPSVKDWRTTITWTKTEQTQDYSNTTAHWHNWLWEPAGGLTAGQIPVHPIVVANEWSCSPFQCLTSCSVPQSALRSEQQKEDINKTALKGGSKVQIKSPRPRHEDSPFYIIALPRFLIIVFGLSGAESKPLNIATFSAPAI